jgi:hypothetical protein
MRIPPDLTAQRKSGSLLAKYAQYFDGASLSPSATMRHEAPSIPSPPASIKALVSNDLPKITPAAHNVLPSLPESSFVAAHQTSNPPVTTLSRHASKNCE